MVGGKGSCGQSPLTFVPASPWEIQKYPLLDCSSLMVRLRVEEKTDFIKQSYDLEDVPDLNYKEIQAICALLLIASSFCSPTHRAQIIP